MLAYFRPATHSLSRRLFSTEAPKVPAKLIGEIRKLTEVSITKAREALAASNNDINLAIEWLEKDLAISGVKKAAKLGDRATGEGLISTCVLSRGFGHGVGGARAAMVELNCETDFVGRNELFGRLAADIAHTAAFWGDCVESNAPFRDYPLDFLNDAPLLSQEPRGGATVRSSIRDMISKVGENICLRRAVALVSGPSHTPDNIGFRVASYAHGSMNVPSQGRIGTLALLTLRSSRTTELFSSAAFQEDLFRLEKSLARQIVGFDTACVQPDDAVDVDTALYRQPFTMFSDNSSGAMVHDVLREWSIKQGLVAEHESDGGMGVVSFKKWTVGGCLSGL